MPIDKLQTSRYEQKYIIGEEIALRIRDFVRAYLELDENGVGKPEFSYPVHSLYLDSDELTTLWCWNSSPPTVSPTGSASWSGCSVCASVVRPNTPMAWPCKANTASRPGACHRCASEKNWTTRQ